jgi:transcriptional regulator with XRE-family HTH domain
MYSQRILMSIQAQAAIRSKKLGVLIRDARQKRRKTLHEAANLVGTTPGIFFAWEEGRRSPSLPELELLAYSFSLPLNHFWGNALHADAVGLAGNLNQKALVSIRQRFIGALLRQAREKREKSLTQLAEQSGVSMKRLRAFELGDNPIPLPELEGLINLLGGSIEDLFDQSGPVGEWMALQQALGEFQQLPRELRDFISKPGNRPYLELAMKLSALSGDKLRSVAESLLDITF